MPAKWLKLVLCISLCALFFWSLHSNFLILDDFHPAEEETVFTPAHAEDIEALDAGKGYHIFIDLDVLMMYVYKGNTLIKTYPVSGGKSSAPTPLGTWRIISKAKWGEGFGGSWMGFNVPWGKYGIHGTIYPWVIGKHNSSKGCIRMNSRDAKELYQIIPHGTTVTIVHNNRPFRTLKNGAIGSDVAEIQDMLRKLGYYKGNIDGKFGAMLTRSVKKFQKDNRLYSNGVITKRTYDLIVQKLSESI